jgi:hypothetical protein
MRPNSRPVDVAERDRPHPLRGEHEDGIVLDAAQDAFHSSCVLDRGGEPEVGFFAHEAYEIGRLLQRPVEPGRGHLEAFEIDVFYGEEPSEVPAHARTILDVDAVRLVDEDANQPGPGREFPVDQLVPHRGQCLLQQLAQIHRRPRRQKKMGCAQPISTSYRVQL